MQFLSSLNLPAKIGLLVAGAAAVIGLGSWGISQLTGVGGPTVLMSSGGAARQFVRNMADGKPDNAMNYVCPSGITILPNIPFSWDNDYFTELEKSENSATVRMEGKARVTQEDWSRWTKELQMEVPEFLTPSVRVFLDFEWSLGKYHGKWCVKESSLTEFINYFTDLIAEEVGL